LSKNSPTISIVDDDNAVCEALKSLVRSLGYHVSTFASPDEFLKSEQVDDTSCLITDVQMPGMSGLDLQDRLVASGHRIPIIFITAYSGENVRARAMKAGAVAFLSKPVNPDHLVGLLEKALKVN
jgi:FixJ family two-component response regulator